MNRMAASPERSAIANNGSGARWSCDYCGRSFDTKSGLGVHKSHVHREELNQERLTAPRRRVRSSDRQRNTISSKSPWTNSEIKALAKMDFDLRLKNPNMSDAALNRELAKLFPGRSVDAIKGQKKGQPFRSALTRVRETENANQPLPNHASIDATATLSSPTTLVSGELEVEHYNEHETNSRGPSLTENVGTNASLMVEPEALSSLPEVPRAQADEANDESSLDASRFSPRVLRSRSRREMSNSENQTVSQRNPQSSVNNERPCKTTSSRCPWTDEEVTTLAKLHLELRLANPDMSEAKLNRELVVKFPGRSIDAIKARKRGQPFRSAVASIREAMEADQPMPNHAIVDATALPSQTTPVNNEHEAGSLEEILNENVEILNASASMMAEPEAIPSQPTVPSTEADDANGVSISDTNINQPEVTRLNYVDIQILAALKDDALAYMRHTKVQMSFRAKHLVHILNMERGHPAVVRHLEQWLDKVVKVDDGGNGNSETLRKPRQRNIRKGYGDGRGLRGKARLTEKVYLQDLYDRRGVKGVAQHVLRDCDGESGGAPIDPEVMKNFWCDVFGSDIRHGNGAIRSTSNEDSTANTIWSVVTVDDIKRTEMEMKKAKGPDGVSVSAWKRIPRSVRALFYNVMLYHGVVLPRLSEARTIFIPKISNPTKPGEFRPISITSVIQRQLHRIFVKRMNAVRKFDDRQVAFRNGVDGVSNNLATLRTIIEFRARERKNLHIISLDLHKAFDSVSHGAVFQILSDLECPTVFINYIKRLYSSATTCLELGNEESAKIRIGRGVFQGDPLSPIIFNHIVDKALKKLDEDYGFPCGRDRITCTAFADDVTVIGDDVRGTQINVDSLVGELALSGLHANAAKCRSLSILWNGTRKTTALSTTPTFKVDDQHIDPITPSTKWKYLGIHFTGEKIDKHLPDIAPKLERVKNALLKPQVKIEVISKVILPQIFHQAILGNSSQEELSTIDILVRKTIREIMHFPHDLPNSYLHAPIRAGGMGVPELLIRIPVLRYVRWKKFAESNGQVAARFDRSIAYRHNKEKVEHFFASNGLGIDDKDIIAKYYLACLDNNIATKGLSEAYHSRQTRGWCNNRSNEISGGDFIKYHHISSCSLPTLARRAWGRPDMDTQCRQGCSTSETAHHVLQECSRTHGGRVLRHDRALNMIHSLLVRKWGETFTIEKEPHIETQLGLRKPDLLLFGGDEAVVIDLHIVGKENMREARCNKVAKYRDLPGLTRIIKDRYGVERVSYEAITVSYCGIIERLSREMLRVLGFRGADIFRITTSVLRGSWLSWFQFKKQHQQPFFDARSRAQA